MTSSAWTTVNIEDVCTVYDGPHATPKKTNMGPIFLGISNLNAGRLDLTDAEHLSEGDYMRWTRRVTPQPDDVVFSYETRLGEAAIIPPGLQCCLGRRMGLLRPRADRLAPRFLLYAFLSPQFQNEIRRRTFTGSTVDRIPLIEFPRFPIHLPSLSDQRDIVAILGALDDKIELNRRMNRTLEAMAQALFQSWFVDFDPVRAKMAGRQPAGMDAETATLFSSALENCALGPAPSGWPVVQLHDDATFVKGVSYASQDLAPSETALVTLKSVARGGGYQGDGLKSYQGKLRPEQVLSPGEVVIAQTDVTQGAQVVGRAARVPASPRYERLAASLDLVVVRSTRPAVSTEYLYGLLSQESFHDHAVGYTNGTTVLHLSPRALPTYTYVRPPDALIERFTALVRGLYFRADLSSDESHAIAIVRDALLPKLLAGEIRVGDAARTIGAVV